MYIVSCVRRVLSIEVSQCQNIHTSRYNPSILSQQIYVDRSTQNMCGWGRSSYIGPNKFVLSGLVSDFLKTSVCFRCTVVFVIR